MLQFRGKSVNTRNMLILLLEITFYFVAQDRNAELKLKINRNDEK